jgi:S1-C subfamily serine protease
VIVAAKAAGSGASDNPLTTGDVIHSLNGETITSLEGLRSTLGRLKPESPEALQIEREGKLMYIAFQME